MDQKFKVILNYIEDIRPAWAKILLRKKIKRMERKKRDKKMTVLVKATGTSILLWSAFLASSFPSVSFSPNLGLGSAPEGRVYTFLTIFIGVVNQQETEQRGTNRNL